jgi:hypothetical protein
MDLLMSLAVGLVLALGVFVATPAGAQAADDAPVASVPGFQPLVLTSTGPLLGEQLAGQSPGGRTLGLGVQIGAPTALTIKYMVAKTQGVVVGAGVGFGWRNGFGPGLSIHADYLFHLAQLINNESLALSFYLGPGVWLSLFSGGYGFGYGYYYSGSFALFGLGVRLPIGLSLALNALPIEIYVELDPALFVFPGVDFGLGASLGFRFYF